MRENRCGDYLGHIREAASDSCDFIRSMNKEEFLADKRTQKAVIMNLVIIGEAATKIMDQYPEFTAQHPQIPWRNMRGMRNRIAHGYFDVDLNVVWETVQTALPELLETIAEID